MQPSRWHIEMLERRLTRLKKLQKGLEFEKLRCGSLEQEIENTVKRLEFEQGWYEEVQCHGFC